MLAPYKKKKALMVGENVLTSVEKMHEDVTKWKFQSTTQ